MIARWRVVQQVADRFGYREPRFAEDEKNLERVREGEIPLVSLEDDLGRVQLRLRREGISALGAIERINGIVNFQDKNVLDKLSGIARAVCRLLKDGRPIGTGFLVSDDIIITNHHVIENPQDAANMLAQFDYELDINQIPKKSPCFKLNSAKFFLTSTLDYNANIPHSGLDFTFIGLEPFGTSGEPLANYPPVNLDGNLGKIIKGESCVIIQHPKGDFKKVVLKDTAFFSETDTRLIYESDTLPGSSGSMVVGLGTCEIIALHHSGLPRVDEQNRILTKKGTIAEPDTPDDEIDWFGNEGIKISKIIQALQESTLSAEMAKIRDTLLKKTKVVAQQLSQPMPTGNTRQKVVATPPVPSSPTSSLPKESTMDTVFSPSTTGRAQFLITAPNKVSTINQIETILKAIYGPGVTITLAMPGSAVEGEVELFAVQLPFSGNVNEEAQNLLKIPGIINAEADVPLLLNADTGFMVQAPSKGTGTESDILFDDGTGEWNESEFIRAYAESKYYKNQPELNYRRWNWFATNFDKLEKLTNVKSPGECGIQIVQFDTGFTDHSKVRGGYDLDHDFNFLDTADPTTAFDPKTIGLGKQPGHGTRTGSLLIGNKNTPITHEGNCGLLTDFNFKLIPYRIAETVIIINRQQQLASALDMAITQGFDIITMSMGLPPTIATAKMAKKAYEKGIIWCCAAGNEVQAVVAPAVYPGTIAVAASNPLDREWPGSSRGSAVDITAPGQAIYVPIWNASHQEDFAYGNGTSYATPHIAAAAACWLAAYQDVLSDPAYAGWKRVEAFRTALASSARRQNDLPRKGFGHGMLDVEKLLKTAPVPAASLEDAYNGWNEHAFFATLQGYGELAKTYWNKFHGWLFGNKRGGQESLEGDALSPFSKQLENSLFANRPSRFESVEPTGADTALQRFQLVNAILENSAR